MHQFKTSVDWEEAKLNLLYPSEEQNLNLP